MTPVRRRALQAEQTRADILRAARVRFAERGYVATSLKVIADDAGVSVQTVYDSIGTKADLVRRLNDLIDAEAEIGDIARSLAEIDPLQVAAVPARVTRRIVERCGDIVRACLDAARAEPELAAIAVEGSRRHQAGAERVAARLLQLRALTADPKDLARTLAALSDARLAFVLIDEHGLDYDDVERWMITTTVAALGLDRPGLQLPAGV